MTIDNADRARAERSFFEGRRVVVTGGLGFIGSNLARRLVALKADVVVTDNFLPEHGANRLNIAGVETGLRIERADIRDRDSLRRILPGADVVFHLAGRVSHILSLKNPFPDIEMNVTGTASLLETIRELKLDPVVVYTGTRGQYGSAERLPVDETQPSHPRALNGLTKLAAEKMMQIYHANHGLRAVPLRLANIYGPRAQMRHPHFGVANWFVRLALSGEPITVFGTGKILRDFVYVDDCVDALLSAGRLRSRYGQVINVGDDKPRCFLDVAEIIARLVPGSRIRFTEFTPERASQEPGNFYSDISRAREILGWTPRTSLEDGLALTVDYYRGRLKEYLAAPVEARPNPGAGGA